MNVLSFFKLQFFLWIFPIVFIIHNWEVSAQVSKWLINNESTMPLLFKQYIPDVYDTFFLRNIKALLFIASILPFLLLWINKRNSNKLYIQYLHTLAANFLIIHSVLIMCFTIFVFRYFPGVVTASIICLPFGYRMLKYCFETYRFALTHKLILTTASLLLYIPLLKLLWKIASIV